MSYPQQHTPYPQRNPYPAQTSGDNVYYSRTNTPMSQVNLNEPTSGYKDEEDDVEAINMRDRSSTGPIVAAYQGYNYNAAGEESEWKPNWPDNTKSSGNAWKITLSVIAGLLVVAGVAVGIYEAVHAKSVASTKSAAVSSNSTTSTSSNSTSSTNSSSSPSQFTLDSALHNSFYGFAYTPTGVILPDCGATQEDVYTDIQLLSQVTTRIRLYSADCNQSSLVLQAIQDVGANITVWLGLYYAGNETVYERNLAEIQTALENYGTDHVSGIIVGNEYILDQAGSSGTSTGTAAVAARKEIIEHMSDTRSVIGNMTLDKTIPVGTADAGSMITTTLCEGADFIMANVHAWWGDLLIDQAAGWVWDYFEENDVLACSTATNNPPVYIAETGWPTDSMTIDGLYDGAGSEASVANLQIFLDDYVCAANTNKTGYFFFEAFNEPWKEEYGTVEPYWGLFNANKTLKGVTVPNCSHL